MALLYCWYIWKNIIKRTISSYTNFLYLSSSSSSLDLQKEMSGEQDNIRPTNSGESDGGNGSPSGFLNLNQPDVNPHNTEVN